MKSLNKKAAYRCATGILSAILVVASLSMSGCSLRSLIFDRDQKVDDETIIQPEDTDAGNSQKPPSDEEIKEDKPSMPLYYNPLTGLASEIDLSLVRPVAVCLGDTNEAMSAAGLGQSEILIEAPAENGKTKLTAVTCTYQAMSQLGAIGVSRPYLLSFSSSLGAVSVCAGASDQLLDSAAEYAFPVIDYAKEGLSTVFYRTEDFPDKLFTSGTRLIGALENFEKSSASLPCEFLPYGTSYVVGDKPASGVVIPYAINQVTQFSYDKTKQIYICSKNATPQEGEAAAPLSFTNLLLLTCESAIHNKVTGTVFELNTENGGRGQYISNGTCINIQWSRSDSGALQITDLNGDPILMNRGKTYIGLLDLANQDSLLIIK